MRPLHQKIRISEDIDQELAYFQEYSGNNKEECIAIGVKQLTPAIRL
jgi:hypothetical protein